MAKDMAKKPFKLLKSFAMTSSSTCSPKSGNELMSIKVLQSAAVCLQPIIKILSILFINNFFEIFYLICTFPDIVAMSKLS